LRFTQRAIALFALVFATSAAGAQATTTASQPLALSVFAGGAGSLIGLSGGKNIDLAVGLDLRIKSFHHFLPSVEARGYKPVDSGGVAGEENAEGGLRIERAFAKAPAVHPYVDFLFGRGKIIYQGDGYETPDGKLIYQNTVSNVLSPGAGVDLDITHYFSLKLDAQFQHYTSVPVTTSGKLWATPITIGVVYRFDFNHHGHASK
jgi:hypothetical protein